MAVSMKRQGETMKRAYDLVNLLMLLGVLKPSQVWDFKVQMRINVINGEWEQWTIS